MLHFHKREQTGNALASDRRASERHSSHGQATLYREMDFMRGGTVGSLHDIAVMGLGLLFDEDAVLPDVGERVKIRLRNDVQRVDREVRGVVKHITQVLDGSYLVGVELTLRLTPLEVSLLKMPTELDDKDTWV